MQFREIQNCETKIVTDFLRQQEFTPIWQAPLWGDFRAQAVQERPRRFGVWRGQELLAYCQILERIWPLNLRFWFGERGPLILANSKGTALPTLLAGITKIARQEKIVGVRFDFPPRPEIARAAANFFGSCNLRVVTKENFPQLTLRLNLRQTEEQLLAAMKPKARYNFRVAQKHGVTVTEITQQSKIKIFYQLLKKTTQRDAFASHPEKFYADFLAFLGPQHASLFLAEQAQVPLAAILVTFYGDTATYYFGASDYIFRNLMAPYACHFAAMRAARARGYRFYDFLGLAPLQDSQHALTGVSTFKRKFGGEEIQYPAGKEMIWRPGALRLVALGRSLKNFLKFFK